MHALKDTRDSNKPSMRNPRSHCQALHSSKGAAEDERGASAPGPVDGGLGRESNQALIWGRLGSSKEGRESLLVPEVVLALAIGCCCAW